MENNIIDGIVKNGVLQLAKYNFQDYLDGTQIPINYGYNSSNININEISNHLIALHQSGENVTFQPFRIFRIDNLMYNEATNNLKFQLVQYTFKPNKVRSIRQNSYSIAIYGQPIIKSKSVVSYDNRINVERFMNFEIFNVLPNLYLWQYNKFAKTLNYTPNWLSSLTNYTTLQNQNDMIKIQHIQPLTQELNKPLEYKIVDRNKEIPMTDSQIKRLKILAFFTFGLSLLKIKTPRKLEKYKNINDKAEEYNKQLYQKWLQNNQNKINELKHWQSLYNNNSLQLNKMANEIMKIKNNGIQNEEINPDDWYNLRDALLYTTNFDNLKGKKGIYIIQNKTKNIYYVGQTKNLYKRIFTQHFSVLDNKPLNEIFINDWDNGNQFNFKIYLCDTKDELDSREKYFINLYDSYKNGYNQTSGNN